MLRKNGFRAISITKLFKTHKFYSIWEIKRKKKGKNFEILNVQKAVTMCYLTSSA